MPFQLLLETMKESLPGHPGSHLQQSQMYGVLTFRIVSCAPQSRFESQTKFNSRVTLIDYCLWQVRAENEVN